MRHKKDEVGYMVFLYRIERLDFGRPSYNVHANNMIINT